MKNIKSFEDFTKDNNKVMNAILNNDVDFIFNFFKNGIIKYEKENEESFQESPKSITVLTLMSKKLNI